LKKHKSRQNYGILQKKEENGIENMQLKTGKILNQNNTIVKNVEKYLKQFLYQNFVVTPVNQEIEENQELTMKLEFAYFVENLLTLINIQRRNAVPINVDVNTVGVKEITQKSPEPVYSLKTTDGTFFVNGILVSNCDALRYGLYTMRSADVKPWDQLPKTTFPLVKPTGRLFGV
jgi:hypothetical protein